MALPPHFQKLLDGCREIQLSHLRPLVDRMFENADIALLDFAEKAESNTAQSVFFDAMAEVRKKHKAIEQKFFSELQQSYAGFPATAGNHGKANDTANSLDDLALVDTDEMELTVATLNATGKLANRIMDRIFALKQRLAVLNGGNAVEENQIPGGPAWLGAAFQRAVQQLELQNKVRIVFIALFEKYILAEIDPVFDEYNKRLIMADILPNLRYEVRKQPGGVEIIRKTAKNPLEQDPPAETVVEPTLEQTPSELGDELFGRICELMAIRRVGSPIANGAAAKIQPSPAGTSPANESARYPGTGTTLLSQLGNIQSGVQSLMTNTSNAEFIENIEIDQHFIDRLQNTLTEERERIFRGIDRRQLPDADNNVIELVGMLFEYMLKEEALPNVVKALLSRLHTPLLKVAVLDRQFFTRTRHPARKLLNDMTSAGIRFVDEAHIERSLFPKMKEIVDRILLEFDQDVTIFESFAEEFETHITELRQRAELVEKRTSEAAIGQDKLLAARARAQEEISGLQHGKSVGTAAHDFLRRLWADKLTFILLRNAEGTESKEWQQSAALARRVVESSLPACSERQREARLQSLDELQQELRQSTSTLQQADKEKLLLALFDSQKQVLEKVVPANTTPVTPKELPRSSEPEQEPAKEPQQLTDKQRAMIAQLKGIPFGTWFEFTGEGDVSQRAKLSWRSTVTEKFMFVDQMGVKAAVISMQELADSMLNGTVRILTVEKKPFVDRALSAIHKMLDRSSRKVASA